MAKNDNAHAVRLAASLERHVGIAAAEKFAGEYPLSKSADVDRKFLWAKNVCAFLENNFTDGLIADIRRDCRCNDGASIAEKLRRYLNKAGSISEFAELFNAGETFAYIEYIDENHILFCYPQCYCACVKRHPGMLSRAWCYCTLGNADCIFRSLLGADVKVSLSESIKTGSHRCAIDVQW